MAEAHVAQVALVRIGPDGNPIAEGSATKAQLEFSTEHRVILNSNIPNTYGEDSEGKEVPSYPTVEDYIMAEAADGFILQHMDQFIIVTIKQ